MKSVSVDNLKAALAGESQAHFKYRYFAKLSEEMGDKETAALFNKLAQEEVAHAFGHLELILKIEHAEPLTPARLLEMAIEGERYESEHMYPEFERQAATDAEKDWAKEHAAESAEHAQLFTKQLQIAQKRFSALKKVEGKHAQTYQARLDQVQGARP